MATNLFLQLCEELHIPHTRDYTNKRFDEHPHKYTLFGLHQLLAEYGVESEGVRFADKAEALATMETPFVAQVSNDLAVVTMLTDTEVCYTWYDETLRVSHETFMELWNGVTLLVAPSSHAGEPHYAEHRHAERMQRKSLYAVMWHLRQAMKELKSKPKFLLRLELKSNINLDLNRLRP